MKYHSPAKEAKIRQELELKLTNFQYQLGTTYASMLLGSEELKNVFHHMDGGERRLHSFTVTDQLLNELILEYSAVVVHIVFRACPDVTMQRIKIELGKILRTDVFNPYEHALVAEKLHIVHNHTAGDLRKPAGRFARRMSLAFRSQAQGDMVPALNKTANKTVARKYNPDENDDVSGDPVNRGNSTTQRRVISRPSTATKLMEDKKKLPGHIRAAAERRIKGVRPAVRAVIHGKSSIITAALKNTTHSIDGGTRYHHEQLKEKYHLETNMVTVNSHRTEELRREHKSGQSQDASSRSLMNKYVSANEKLQILDRSRDAKVPERRKTIHLRDSPV